MNRRVNIFLSVFALVGALAAPRVAAAPIVFDLSGTFFLSGWTLTGTLTADTATGLATGVDVTISATPALNFPTIQAQGLAAPGVYDMRLNTGVPDFPILDFSFLVDGFPNLAGYAGGVLSGTLTFGPGEHDLLSGVAARSVPEPATLFLLGLSLVGWAASRLRK